MSKIDSGYKYWWSSDTLDPYTGQNIAVISKFPAAIKPVTRLDQTTQEYIDHRERPRIGSLGKFLRVDIEVDNNVLTLFVTHLKSQRGGPEKTRLLRQAQAKIIRRLTLPRVEQGNTKYPSFVAVVGDLNDTPKSSPLDIIQGKTDSSYKLESATIDLDEKKLWTYEYKSKKQQLDHILLSKFAYDRMLKSGISRFSREVSDHDAVWTRIDLTK